MDRFTRNYSIGLGIALGVVVIVVVIASWNPEVSRLNDLLADDAELAAYPYQFRVASLSSGVATMKSPRSFEVPVIRFLAISEPRLAGKSADDPDVMKAQERLAYHQKRAQDIVARQPEVTAVRWILDREWYSARGIPLR